MTDWERCEMTQKLECHRSGWRGVWDLFWATIRGKSVPTIANDVTISFWVKGNKGVSLADIQMEMKQNLPVNGEVLFANKGEK